MDTPKRTVKYIANSTARGIAFRGFAWKAVGEAKRERGSVMSSRSTGRIRMDEDSDKWTRNASVSKAADVRPNSRFGQYGGISLMALPSTDLPRRTSE